MEDAVRDAIMSTVRVRVRVRVRVKVENQFSVNIRVRVGIRISMTSYRYKSPPHPSPQAGLSFSQVYGHHHLSQPYLPYNEIINPLLWYTAIIICTISATFNRAVIHHVPLIVLKTTRFRPLFISRTFHIRK